MMKFFSSIFVTRILNVGSYGFITLHQLDISGGLEKPLPRSHIISGAGLPGVLPPLSLCPLGPSFLRCFQYPIVMFPHHDVPYSKHTLRLITSVPTEAFCSLGFLGELEPNHCLISS